MIRPSRRLDVTLSMASGKEVSVGWTSADGTATVAGNDFTPDAGTLAFDTRRDRRRSW